MADKHLIELGRRAVACKGWRWLSGMRTLAQSVCLDGRRFVDSKYPGEPFEVRHGFGLPDLRDACTLGGLLALVREAYGVTVYVVDMKDHGLDHWRVIRGTFAHTLGSGLTEAEALVSALESAP